MLFSRAGRDDADSFFAIMSLPVDVHHKRHGNNFQLVPNRANRVPMYLACCGIDAVRDDQAQLVLEDESGQLERDPVGPLVSQILWLVPFVSH
jgi:hypothetical protein